jgi:acyl carrier protein
VEERLARIWAEVLGVKEIGVHDSFLELGGDSLLATQVISRVMAHFQVRPPLRALLQAPTVAEMAVVILQSQAGKLQKAQFDQLLADLDALSEEEARALLSKRAV